MSNAKECCSRENALWHKRKRVKWELRAKISKPNSFTINCTILLWWLDNFANADRIKKKAETPHLKGNTLTSRRFYVEQIQIYVFGYKQLRVCVCVKIYRYSCLLHKSPFGSHTYYRINCSSIHNPSYVWNINLWANDNTMAEGEKSESRTEQENDSKYPSTHIRFIY